MTTASTRTVPGSGATTTRDEVHVLTPGDHFSPRTGSAVPTVVDGLCAAVPADGRPVPRVVVARGTYPDRYPSAQAVEYDPAPPRAADRYLDAAAGRLGLPRPGARRTWGATLAGQRTWPGSVVLAHNAAPLVPLVADRHQVVLYAHNQLLRTYTRREAGRVLGRAAAICAVSEDLAEQLGTYLPPSLAQRLRVVRNGVDTDRFTPRADPGRTGPLRVTFVGRMIRDKGADVLLDAVALLGRADIEVTVVGSQNFDAAAELSPFERAVHDRAAEIGDRVRLRPFVPRAQVPDVFRAADVVVVPSRWAEPFALTVLEGMACGVPVVASRIGGIPEVMGPAGVLVRPDDPADLAAALAALADDETLRRSLGAGCRTWALAHDWHASRRALDAVLAEVA